MYEARVKRGTTYSRRSKLSGDKLDQEKRKHRPFQRKSRQKEVIDNREEVIDGNSTSLTQTDCFLEEVYEKPVELSGFCQTDEFLPPDPEPLYMRPRYGIDVESQVDAKEVFDFDEEVNSLLEALVGKTLQNSIGELLQEIELEKLSKTEQKFQNERKLRNSNLARKKQQMYRLEKERELRKVEQRKKADALKQRVKESKITRTTEVFVDEISETVFKELISSGKIEDPVRRQIRSHFFPWLEEQANFELSHRKLSETLINCIIEAVVTRINEGLDYQ